MCPVDVNNFCISCERSFKLGLASTPLVVLSNNDGRRWRKLNAIGTHTVLDLRNASPKEIRSQFGVVMERTCSELRGISCLTLEDIAPARQQIMSSRSFGVPVESIEELQEAVACYTTRAAEKLRQQQSISAAVHIFLQTNRFKDDEPQYHPGITMPLIEATDDTRTLISAAIRGLKHIFRPGFHYKKAGVMLTLLSDKTVRQGSLFESSADRERSTKLMAVVDAINLEFGAETLHCGAEGVTKHWAMRARKLSPRYTTRWDELPVVS